MLASTLNRSLEVSISPPHRPADSELQLIAEGSFGQIFHWPQQTTVYKTVREDGHHLQLLREFECYSAASSIAHQPQAPGEFGIPRPWQYWQPIGIDQPGRIINAANSHLSVLSPRYEANRELSSRHLWSEFQLPTFTMDLIPSLHPVISQRYKLLFWAEKIRHTMSIRLLRLYFGRTNLPAVTISVQPGLKSDPPLDVSRYERLAEDLESYGIQMPTPQQVAAGMGQVLARLHWLVGINASDIELVLGGSPAHGVQLYAFDFNQCKQWLLPDALHTGSKSSARLTCDKYAEDTLSQAAKRLAILIFTQELYYPRPHQTGLYEHFKDGYMGTIEAGRDNWAAYAKEVQSAADCFFEEYERLDAEKQARTNRLKR
ncbi:hypothetical protein BCR39DRAFT_539259 [Naematelia encephala]|uniref:DUF3669 domain-containing protein n=1 Tax=Naematelia encephala TaxID=71784 RepID=A0A1Y2AX07_9TREE|nr:hypothetical protein BCR39DRAFT_539259 [Naematelia encephala]